jgi:hypothetical protein
MRFYIPDWVYNYVAKVKRDRHKRYQEDWAELSKKISVSGRDPKRQESYHHPKDVKLFRKFNFLFPFYGSSTAHDYLVRFRTHLIHEKCPHAKSFVLHHIRKLAIRSVRDEKGEKGAQTFAQHRSVDTLRIFYLNNNISRERIPGLDAPQNPDTDDDIDDLDALDDDDYKEISGNEASDSDDSDDGFA